MPVCKSTPIEAGKRTLRVQMMTRLGSRWRWPLKPAFKPSGHAPSASLTIHTKTCMETSRERGHTHVTSITSNYFFGRWKNIHRLLPRRHIKNPWFTAGRKSPWRGQVTNECISDPTPIRTAKILLPDYWTEATTLPADGCFLPLPPGKSISSHRKETPHKSKHQYNGMVSPRFLFLIFSHFWQEKDYP